MNKTMAKFMVGPAAEWYTRFPGDRSYQVVRTGDPKHLRISFMPGQQGDGIAIMIHRTDARLLARRIIQCLEATK